jgi:hypothetical protein
MAMGMELTMKIFGRLAALALAAVLLGAADRPKPADLSDTRWAAQLEKDLASEDFARRQEGQKELERVSVGQREELQRLASGVVDEDARASMLARVDVLEELALTDPPGLSLVVREGSLADVAAALSAAQPEPIGAADTPRLLEGERFTLKAENTRFWEIERRLSEKNPVWFESSPTGIKLVLNAPGWRRTVQVRGFEVCAQNPRWPDPQGVGGTNIPLPIGSPARYVCVMGLGIDPRIAVAAIGVPKAGVVDERGNRWKYTVLARPPAPKPAKVITMAHTLALEPPKEAGETLTIAGTWPVTLQLDEGHVEWRRFDVPPEGALRLGDVDLEITRLVLMNPAAGLYNLQITTEIAAAREAPGWTAATPAPITMKLVDGEGRVMASRAVAVDALKSSAAIELKAEPVKIVFSRPGRTRVYAVPFEFKNLAVP